MSLHSPIPCCQTWMREQLLNPVCALGKCVSSPSLQNVVQVHSRRLLWAAKFYLFLLPSIATALWACEKSFMITFSGKLTESLRSCLPLKILVLNYNLAPVALDLEDCMSMGRYVSLHSRCVLELLRQNRWTNHTLHQKRTCYTDGKPCSCENIGGTDHVNFEGVVHNFGRLLAEAPPERIHLESFRNIRFETNFLHHFHMEAVSYSAYFLDLRRTLCKAWKISLTNPLCCLKI